jgi:DNA-binding MarR family transcriptional regulator
MPEQSTYATISFLLGYICKANHNAAESALAAAGLHAGQEQFLSSLWAVDGLTQVELAQNMCVQPPTVNKMLSRLEAAGLVERRLDPDDNRFSRVYLTAQGRKVKHDVEQAFAKLEARVVANLSLEERVILRRLLLQVNENLKDA